MLPNAKDGKEENKSEEKISNGNIKCGIAGWNRTAGTCGEYHRRRYDRKLYTG